MLQVVAPDQIYKYIWVISWEIYSQNFFSTKYFFLPSLKIIDTFFYILIMDEKVLVLCEK